MTAVKITASAGYLPEKVVTNDELSQLMDTSDGMDRVPHWDQATALCDR